MQSRELTGEHLRVAFEVELVARHPMPAAEDYVHS